MVTRNQGGQKANRAGQPGQKPVKCSAECFRVFQSFFSPVSHCLCVCFLFFISDHGRKEGSVGTVWVPLGEFATFHHDHPPGQFLRCHTLKCAEKLVEFNGGNGKSQFGSYVNIDFLRIFRRSQLGIVLIPRFRQLTRKVPW